MGSDAPDAAGETAGAIAGSNLVDARADTSGHAGANETRGCPSEAGEKEAGQEEGGQEGQEEGSQEGQEEGGEEGQKGQEAARQAREEGCAA
ncbi:MAG TPA: hypothetical protein VJL31_15210 [Gemmatimonadales bacterium]|nr:hypothetical protein [Gemmatimonadales bacterium]